MKLEIRSRKLQRDLTDEKRCRKRYGSKMADKLRIRLSELNAAESLADFWPPNSGPERCHRLPHEGKNVFSMDLVHPYRLLFGATAAALADAQEDEHKRWASIKEVEVLNVVDTHG